MHKISSGIDGLDQILFGGLPRGRAVLVAGEPGTGKTTLCLQYLYHGLQQGESCLFVSIDEKPEHVLADAQSLGWELEPFLISGKLQILDITQHFGGLYLSEAQVDLGHVVQTIMQRIADIGATRVVVDPLAPLIFGNVQRQYVISYIKNLVFSLEESGSITALLTSYVPVGTEKNSLLGVEEFAASGIVLLRLEQMQHRYVRTLRVKKMRGTRMELSPYHMEIIAQRGVVVRNSL